MTLQTLLSLYSTLINLSDKTTNVYMRTLSPAEKMNMSYDQLKRKYQQTKEYKKKIHELVLMY
jgi:hypothetical protein